VKETKQVFAKYDSKNTGHISFSTLRMVLENIDKEIKEEYVEYIIFLMKQNENDNFSLEELNYKV